MNPRLRSLLGKEWRDARIVTIASVVLSIVIVAGAPLTPFKDTVLLGLVLVPAMASIYGMTVAADMAAGELLAGRAATSALLPVADEYVWRSKALFLGAATLGFAVWSYLLQVAVFRLTGQTELLLDFMSAAPLALPATVLGLGLAFSTFALSILIERGFAAVVCAAILGGPFVGVPWLFKEPLAHLDYRPGQGILLVGAVVIVLTWAAASRAAYLRPPLHIAARLHRTVATLLVPCIVGVAASLVAAIALHRWVALEPGDEAVVVQGVAAAPNAARVALMVEKREQQESSHVWIADADTGSVTTLPWRSALPAERPWSRRGTIRVRHPAGGLLWPGTSITYRDVDPTTGDVLQSETVHASHMPEDESRWPNLGWTWHRWGRARPDPTNARDGVVVIDWRERGSTHRVTRLPGAWLGLTAIPGVVLYWQPDRQLVRHDLGSDTVTPLLRATGRQVDSGLVINARTVWHLDPGPDGTRVIARGDDGPVVIDVADSRVVTLGCAPSDVVEWTYMTTSSRHVVVWRHADDTFAVVDLDAPSGPRSVEVGRTAATLDAVTVLSDGRVAVIRPGGRVVDLLDAGGRRLRRLYPRERDK